MAEARVMSPDSQATTVSITSKKVVESSSGLERRWLPLLGGIVMNLAFGNIYAWSVFVAPLEKQFGWKRADTSMVFTIAICMTAFMSWLSGSISDRWGPSFCAFAGGILASAGFFLSAFARTLPALLLCFGLIGGLGTGLGCTVIIAVLAKWFPDKRGLAMGLAVGAFSASSAVFGPFAAAVFIPRYGIAATFEILGIIFFGLTMAGALLLKDPPRAYLSPGWTPRPNERAAPAVCQFTPREMLKTSSFYWMWFGYALGCASGLMVISQLIPYLNSRGIDNRSVAIAVLILGAAASIAGRVCSGWMSDALGRLYVLRLTVAASAIAMPVLYATGTSVVLLYATVALVYFCYGTQFSVNAAACADFWGTRHVGLNYGIFITAWGVAGIIGPRIGGVLYDRNHNYHSAFLSAGILAGLALLCELIAKRPESPLEKNTGILIAEAD
jgi:OFA family oxalate/formate antiporter-like MFS transporter